MKKLFAFILTITMIISTCICTVSISAADATVWDGSVASSFASGSGTQSSPYVISTPAQWAYFAKQVTNGTTYSGKYIQLGADILFNTGNASDWKNNPPSNVVPRVGKDGKKFSGNFNGNGKTISGVYMYGETDDGIGLFSDVKEATISNLLLVNSYICGEDYVGAIAGEVAGATTIENVYIHSNVYVEATQSVSGKYAQTGGFVGACYGTPQYTLIFNDCVFAGTVQKASCKGIGGFLGAGNSSKDPHSVTFNNCLMIGSVPNDDECGGFFSTNNNASAITTITGCIYAGSQFGSFPFGSGASDGIVNVTNSYSTEFNNNKVYRSQGTSKKDNVEQIVLTDLYGINANITLSGWTKRSYDIMVPTGVAAFAPTSGLFEGDIWDGTVADAFAGGDGTQTNPYLISNAAQFAYFAKYVNDGGVTAGKYFKLTADIVLNKEIAFTPIAAGVGGWASFKGDFDGNGKTISEVKVDTNNTLSTPDEVWTTGLFGCTGATANIHDFILSDSYFTGINPVGAVAGMANIGATYKNIYVDDLVLVDNKLGDGAGGIIGQLTSSKTGETNGSQVTIDSCVNAGTIKVTKEHTTSNEGMHAGGIIGNGNGMKFTVSNCLNMGTIYASYQYAAGIVGREDSKNGTITNCVNIGRVICENDPSNYAREIIISKSSDAKPTVTNCYYLGNMEACKNASETNTQKIDILDFIGTNAKAPSGWIKRGGDFAIPSGLSTIFQNKQLFTIRMLDGASVRLKEPTGLRFTAILSKSYLNSITDVVEYGILIAPKDYVEDAKEFTINALEKITVSSGDKYLKIPCSNILKQTDDYIEYTGVIANIYLDHYWVDFSAIAYIKTSNDTIYSNYNELSQCRSIAYVAQAALADVKSTQDETYAYKVTDSNLYSCYTENERELLQGFCEKGSINVEFLSYNIRNVEGGDSLYGDPLTFEYDNRNIAVRDYLIQTNSDVIGLQEASKKENKLGTDSLDWFDTLGDDTKSPTGSLTQNGYTCYKGPNVLPSSDKKEMYNPIYFKTNKYTLITSGYQWLTDDGTQKEVSGAYKAITYVVLEEKTTNIQFIYVNAHVGRTSEGQELMAGYLKTFLLNLKSTYDCPIIIAGDFNGSYSDFKGYDTFYGNTAISVRDNAKTKINGNSEVNTTFDGLTNRSGPIDLYFALNTDNLVIQSYKVTDNKNSTTGKYPSDHLPVIVDTTIFG